MCVGMHAPFVLFQPAYTALSSPNCKAVSHRNQDCDRLSAKLQLKCAYQAGVTLSTGSVCLNLEVVFSHKYHQAIW